MTLLRKFEESGVSLKACNHLHLSFCCADGDTVCNGHAVVLWQMAGELVRNSGAVSIDWGGGLQLISVASPRRYLRCDGTRLNVITLCRKRSTALLAAMCTKLERTRQR